MSTSPTSNRMVPLAGIQRLVSRRNRLCRQSEDGIEGRHRVKAAIEAEDEFVEVGLQMVLGDGTVMSAHDPCFEIGENEVDHWQVGVGLLCITIENQSFMVKAERCHRVVTDPGIGSDGGTLGDAAFDKTHDRRTAAVGDDSKPQAACIDASLVSLLRLFPQPHFDSTNHCGHVMNAPALSPRPAADKALIHFDWMLPANAVTFRAHHASSEFVEDLEGCLIPGKPKLALELHGGLPRSLCRHEVSPPEPSGQRRMGGLHHSARCERGVGFADAAAEHHGRP